MKSKKSFNKKMSPFFTKGKINKIGTSKIFKQETPKSQITDKSNKEISG